MNIDEESDIFVEEYLEHYGVLGMKWGVRRDHDTGVRPIANTLNKSRFGQPASKKSMNKGRKWLIGAGSLMGIGLLQLYNVRKIKAEEDLIYSFINNRL